MPSDTPVTMRTGTSARWAAARLQAVGIPAAQEAVRLLRARERDAACAVLEAALVAMAGPEDARGLAWFKPTIEQVRDERRRPW